MKPHGVCVVQVITTPDDRYDASHSLTTYLLTHSLTHSLTGSLLCDDQRPLRGRPLGHTISTPALPSSHPTAPHLRKPHPHTPWHPTSGTRTTVTRPTSSTSTSSPAPAAPPSPPSPPPPPPRPHLASRPCRTSACTMCRPSRRSATGGRTTRERTHALTLLCSRAVIAPPRLLSRAVAAQLCGQRAQAA
jgi:hypothetical protein